MMNEQILKIEKEVLGTFMIQPEKIEDCIKFLYAPEVFGDLAHRIIYREILALHESGVGFDWMALADSLTKSKQLESVGGVDYLVSCTDVTTGGGNVSSHSAIIAEQFIKRKAGDEGKLIQARAMDAKADPFDIVDRSIHGLESIMGGFIRDRATMVGDIAPEMIIELNRKIEARAKAEAEGEQYVSGIPTGHKVVDSLTSGFQDGTLTIIGARPAMGKTAFALKMARKIGEAGTPVLFFSLEMSKEQLTNRLMSSISGVSTKDIISGKVNQSQLESVTFASNQLAGVNLTIEDTPGANIRDLQVKAKAWKRRNKDKKGGAIFVDYLQLMSGLGKSGQNREQEISGISRGLKVLAKELMVPIVALSQLGRAVESRQSKRPQLSDLRESGAIEQDADMVWFIYRPIVYKKAYIINEYKDALFTLNQSYPNQGYEILCKMGFLLIEKNREGPCESIPMIWKGSTVQFFDVKSPEVYAAFGVEQEVYGKTTRN